MSICASNAGSHFASSVSSHHRMSQDERWAVLNKKTFQDILNSILSQTAASHAAGGLSGCGSRHSGFAAEQSDFENVRRLRQFCGGSSGCRGSSGDTLSALLEEVECRVDEGYRENQWQQSWAAQSSPKAGVVQLKEKEIQDGGDVRATVSPAANFIPVSGPDYSETAERSVRSANSADDLSLCSPRNDEVAESSYTTMRSRANQENPRTDTESRPTSHRPDDNESAGMLVDHNTMCEGRSNSSKSGSDMIFGCGRSIRDQPSNFPTPVNTERSGLLESVCGRLSGLLKPSCEEVLGESIHDRRSPMLDQGKSENLPLRKAELSPRSLPSQNPNVNTPPTALQLSLDETMSKSPSDNSPTCSREYSRKISEPVAHTFNFDDIASCQISQDPQSKEYSKLREKVERRNRKSLNRDFRVVDICNDIPDENKSSTHADARKPTHPTEISDVVDYRKAFDMLPFRLFSPLSLPLLPFTGAVAPSSPYGFMLPLMPDLNLFKRLNLFGNSNDPWTKESASPFHGHNFEFGGSAKAMTSPSFCATPPRNKAVMGYSHHPMKLAQYKDVADSDDDRYFRFGRADRGSLEGAFNGFTTMDFSDENHMTRSSMEEIGDRGVRRAVHARKSQERDIISYQTNESCSSCQVSPQPRFNMENNLDNASKIHKDDDNLTSSGSTKDLNQSPKSNSDDHPSSIKAKPPSHSSHSVVAILGRLLSDSPSSPESTPSDHTPHSPTAVIHTAGKLPISVPCQDQVRTECVNLPCQDISKTSCVDVPCHDLVKAACVNVPYQDLVKTDCVNVPYKDLVSIDCTNAPYQDLVKTDCDTRHAPGSNAAIVYSTGRGARGSWLIVQKDVLYNLIDRLLNGDRGGVVSREGAEMGRKAESPRSGRAEGGFGSVAMALGMRQQRTGETLFDAPCRYGSSRSRPAANGSEILRRAPRHPRSFPKLYSPLADGPAHGPSLALDYRLHAPTSALNHKLQASQQQRAGPSTFDLFLVPPVSRKPVTSVKHGAAAGSGENHRRQGNDLRHENVRRHENDRRQENDQREENDGRTENHRRQTCCEMERMRLIETYQHHRAHVHHTSFDLGRGARGGSNNNVYGNRINDDVIVESPGEFTEDISRRVSLNPRLSISSNTGRDFPPSAAAVSVESSVLRSLLDDEGDDVIKPMTSFGPDAFQLGAGEISSELSRAFAITSAKSFASLSNGIDGVQSVKSLERHQLSPLENGATEFFSETQTHNADVCPDIRFVEDRESPLGAKSKMAARKRKRDEIEILPLSNVESNTASTKSTGEAHLDRDDYDVIVASRDVIGGQSLKWKSSMLLRLNKEISDVLAKEGGVESGSPKAETAK